MVLAGTETYSALELFVRDYVDVCGGVWEEVEPQVYDVLLPPDELAVEPGECGARELLRIAFDPEAASEYPRSQLASYGTPLIDRLLDRASRHGRYARVYVNGLSLAHHAFLDQLQRNLSLSRDVVLTIDQVRPLDFPQAIFWFQATMTSDQVYHHTVPIAMDLHSGRQVRHLDRLLEEERIGQDPSLLLPEAFTMTVAQTYPHARQQAVRTLLPLAGTRARQLDKRLSRQIARTTRYYDDLRSELDQQQREALQKGGSPADSETRRAAVNNEQRARIVELRRSHAQRVQLRLLNLMIVHQPKLLACGMLRTPQNATKIELVWDPLDSSLEAPPCPTCGTPSFSFWCRDADQPICPACTQQEKQAIDAHVA